MILFVYGTLLDPRILIRITGDAALARRLRPARLAGWRRVVLRGTPYPTLVEAADAAVGGALLRVGVKALARLSAYEGSAYALVPVTVAVGRTQQHALTWIAPRWRADAARGWP